VRELRGSIARQLAQTGQWKYSLPYIPCSVYEWGLAGGQESSLFFHEFGLCCEFKLFQEFHEIHESCDRYFGTGYELVNGQ